MRVMYAALTFQSSECLISSVNGKNLAKCHGFCCFIFPPEGRRRTTGEEEGLFEKSRIEPEPSRLSAQFLGYLGAMSKLQGDKFCLNGFHITDGESHGADYSYYVDITDESVVIK